MGERRNKIIALGHRKAQLVDLALHHIGHMVKAMAQLGNFVAAVNVGAGRKLALGNGTGRSIQPRQRARKHAAHDHRRHRGQRNHQKLNAHKPRRRTVTPGKHIAHAAGHYQLHLVIFIGHCRAAEQPVFLADLREQLHIRAVFAALADQGHINAFVHAEIQRAESHQLALIQCQLRLCAVAFQAVGILKQAAAHRALRIGRIFVQHHLDQCSLARMLLRGGGFGLPNVFVKILLQKQHAPQRKHRGDEQDHGK